LVKFDLQCRPSRHCPVRGDQQGAGSGDLKPATNRRSRENSIKFVRVA
jgi:hypothetical protein